MPSHPERLAKAEFLVSRLRFNLRQRRFCPGLIAAGMPILFCYTLQNG